MMSYQVWATGHDIHMWAGGTKISENRVLLKASSFHEFLFNLGVTLACCEL